MTAPGPTGILLPQSTISSPWFLLFAAFVAVNTIIYLGLTLSKVILWPKPMHPRRVRALLGIKPPTEENAVTPLRQSVSRETPAESGIHDIARAFGWLGAVMLLSSMVFVVLEPRLVNGYLAFAAGLVFLSIAQVISRTKVSGRTASWLWAVSAAVLAVATTFAATMHDIERLGVILVLTAVFGAVTLTWPSFVFGMTLLAGSFAGLGYASLGLADPAWLIACAAAVIASALLLVNRRRSLRILMEVDRLENQLGSTDVLTGVLTRQGLITLGPSVRRAAARAKEPMFVMIVDIDDLESANRSFGMGYGDDLLRAVAAGIRTAARDADLLGRWSGDEFALMGMGAQQSVEALTERITRAIADSPVALGKPPLRVRIGFATGSADGLVETLVERALAELRGAPETPAETEAA
jgi:diguanylate cyclase (GGDEF)-like protein